MATGAIASSGAWVPTLAVYQPTPKTTRNPKHRKVRVLGTQPLAVSNCEVLGSSSLPVHLMPQGGGPHPRGTTSYCSALPFSSEDVSLEPQCSELVQ